MHLRQTFSLVIFFALIPSNLCWHPQIHSIIGYIAEKKLKTEKPAVLEKVLKMLSPITDFFSETKDSLMEASAMPNEISVANFNFLDKTRYSGKPILYWKDIKGDVNIPNSPFAYNITSSMNQTQLIVKQSLNQKDAEGLVIKPGLIDSLMLRYMLNFTGNLHHPLANSSFYSKSLFEGKLMDGDQNGKLIPVNDVLGIDVKNLKSLYDHAFGALNLKRKKEMQYPYSEDFAKEIKNQADYLMNKYPETYFERIIDKLNYIDWSEESYNLASDFVYSQVELFPILNPEYIITGRRICEERITLAGYRLYKMLIQLFTSKSRVSKI